MGPRLLGQAGETYSNECLGKQAYRTVVPQNAVRGGEDAMAHVGSDDKSERSPKSKVGNQLAGSTVSGGVVQAGVIHGDINLGASPGFEPRVPQQLPAPPTHFTNREAELAELDSLLDPAASRLAPEVVVVTGFAGVGKTALALRWAAAHLDRFTGGQLFADLAGVGTAEPASVSRTLGAFLRSAGFPLHQIPADESERAALWRSWTAQRAVLVVLDNAHSAAQVRALIPGSAASVVVVTSRKRLAGLAQGGARSVEVAPLDLRSGLELLRRSIGGSRVEREPDQARRLVSLCGGLPIAVCVAAAQLSSRPVRSIQGAVRDLSRRGSRLAVLSRSEELSVRAVFDSSYHDLPAEPARLYRLASLHPGEVFSAHAAAVLADVPLAEATRLLDVLVDANLLQETSEDRYQFHDLVRQHAHEQAEAAGEAGTGAMVRTRICEWYLRAAQAAVLAATGSRRRKEYAFTTTAPAFVLPEELESADGSWAWLDVEQGAIVAAMKAASEAGRPELAWHLADVTRPLLRIRKDFRLAQEVEREGLAAARAWGERHAERSMLKRLARSCSELGDHAQAQGYAREALRLAEADQDARGTTSARKALALLLVDQGRYGEAEGPLREIVDSYRVLGRIRRRATTEITLGAVLLALGRPAEAAPFLESSVELLGDLDPPDEYNLARARAQLGQARIALGDLGVASTLLAAALAVLVRLGSRFEQALVHEALADVSLARDDDRGARRHLTSAVTLLRTLGSAQADRVARKIESG